MKTGRAEMVPALSRRMKRLHLSRAAIEAANVADERAREEWRHIDALKLLVESTDGAVNGDQEWLCAGRRAGDRGFQTQELLPE